MNSNDHRPALPDTGPCDLYVHLKPANALQDISPIISWLSAEYHAVQVLSTSYQIAAENLYKSNNVDSFMMDFLEFVGSSFPGLEVVVCPTNYVCYFSLEEDDPGQDG